MAELSAADLAVVIPTRDRWAILQQTLSSLSRQSVTGFETIVVVDGTDQAPPQFDVSQVLVKRRAGPGAARNAGARATGRYLVMFIGDDTIPEADFIERHLAAHRRHPEREAGVVGLVNWHQDVARNRINKWLDWSGTQFWYTDLADEGEQQVSHWHFYTSNVSVKRDFLLEIGGFDEDFPFAAFEDLECALRLSRLGFRLYYEPAAICHHLHDYDWPGLERRFATMALSERLMMEMHPELEARSLGGMKASALGHALPLELFVDVVPRRWKRLDGFVRRQVDRRYHRRLAPTYLQAWDRAAELCDLRRYLGERYDSGRLVYRSAPQVKTKSESQAKTESIRDETLYENVRRALEGRTDQLLTRLRHHLPSGARVLDYRCGIGTDGLRLAESGYLVSFADLPGATLSYLRWRLDVRGLRLPVYDLGTDELPGDFDAAVCLDAARFGRDPVALVNELQQVAPIVALGLPPDSRRPSSHTSLASDLFEFRDGHSRLVARHQLPDDSLLLIYEQRTPTHSAPAERASEPSHDASMPGSE
jgi:glycosyltransferase involved in cell wall biosynthesis